MDPAAWPARLTAAPCPFAGTVTLRFQENGQEIGHRQDAFCRVMGEFGITLMVAGGIPGKTQTLPLAIYDHVQANQMGEANVLALIAIGAVGTLLFGLSQLVRLRY